MKNHTKNCPIKAKLCNLYSSTVLSASLCRTKINIKFQNRPLSQTTYTIKFSHTIWNSIKLFPLCLWPPILCISLNRKKK